MFREPYSVAKNYLHNFIEENQFDQAALLASVECMDFD
jgi:hypothetical protein